VTKIVKLLTYVILVLISPLLFTHQFYFQVLSLPAAVDNSRGIRVERDERLVSDILSDLEKLKPSSRSRFYAELAETYWETDRVRSLNWYEKCVQIALDPKTNFADHRQKLNLLTTILIHNSLKDKDRELSSKVISAINRVISKQSAGNDSSDLNSTLIFVANSLVDIDEKLAFQYAVRSLTGNKPVINSNSYQFLSRLRKQNEKLSNDYFSKLVTALRNDGSNELLSDVLFDLSPPSIQSDKADIECNGAAKKGTVADFGDVDQERVRSDNAERKG
jgi:hypothetical protein